MSEGPFERERRINKILELLRANPQGLSIQTIAKETGVLTSITRNRLEKYIEELSWCGMITVHRDGRIKIKG